MKNVIPVLKLWILSAAVVSLVCGIIYVCVQQTYRSNANDPQIQMATDAVAALNNGADPKMLISSSITEISHSLKPFMIIYDGQGNPLAADGLLDGKIPSLPNGVLDFTRKNSEDVITWQPRTGVRNALVVEYTNSPLNYFVVAGRSLRMVEEREQKLVMQLVFGWVVTLGLMLLLVSVLQVLFRPQLQTEFVA